MSKTIKTKSGRKVILPTQEEEDIINAGIRLDPDNPEFDDEAYKNAKPAKEFFSPEMYAALTSPKRPRGRPVSDTHKVVTSIRLDADLFAALKASGRGWQTRVNAILREHMKEDISG